MCIGGVVHLKWLKEWMRTIQGKFILLAVIVGLIPLLMVGMFSFLTSYNNLVAVNEKSTYSNRYIIYENLKSTVKQLESLARQILNDQIIAQAMQQARETNAYLTNRLESRLSNHIAGYALPVTAALFTMDGERVARNTNWGEGKGWEKSGGEDNDATDWFQHAVGQNGLETYYLTNLLTTQDAYSTTKLLRDMNTGEPYAMLVINVRASVFSEFLPGEIESTGVTYALADKRTGVVQAVAGTLDGDAISYILEKLDDDGGDWNFDAEFDTRSAFHVVSIIDQKALIGANLGILTATLIMAVVLIIVAIPSSLIFARTNTRTISRLQQMVEKLEKGRRLESESFGDDEMGKIGNALQDIASSNRDLKEQLVMLSMMEKEAKLQALQFQINPHFLYNTLSSIYWLSKLGKNDEAARAAVLLSDIFKYVIDTGSDLVTVEAELKHIDHYLELQNIRYNQSIQVNQEIEAGLESCMILRFILQPIVENAICHGLEPKVGERRLYIGGHREGKDVVFVVEDNGVGMSDLHSVQSSHGTRNVMERIRLKYGDRYGCTFESELGEGTRVTIRIPAGQE